jgi:nucleotide-binding universal stress UspA family protein
MFQRLLIATDMVDGLQRLAAHGADLARAGAKAITFLHTVPLMDNESVPREDQAKLQQSLEQFQTLQSAGQSSSQQTAKDHTAKDPAFHDRLIQFEVRSGRPIPVVSQYIQQQQPDLVILGTAVRNLLGEKLFGSNTQGILQQTSAPLLILRPQLLQTFLEDELAIRCQQLWRHLLIPVDGSHSSARMVEQLQARCAKADTPPNLTFCWVVDTVGESDKVITQRTAEAQTHLQALTAPLVSQGIAVSQQIRQGNPVLEVTTAARELAVSAIITSSGNVGRFWELSIPSFAGELIRRSWHPILFLPVSKS